MIWVLAVCMVETGRAEAEAFVKEKGKPENEARLSIANKGNHAATKLRLDQQPDPIRYPGWISVV
ncbi:hypothetical protein NB311A_01674 [Nitrobacter sp. Nb-311A]|nr:hypothetical protein NB311A_01674 [Nitrobacter sp. Nb-311A]